MILSLKILLCVGSVLSLLQYPKVPKIVKRYFSVKLCILVTVALDIFIKEKNNTSYLPWISPLSFFYAKGVYSVKLS